MSRRPPRKPTVLSYAAPEPSRFRADSRGMFALAAVALALGYVVAYAQARSVAVIFLVLTDGALVAGWVLAAALLGRPVLRVVLSGAGMGGDDRKGGAARTTMSASPDGTEVRPLHPAMAFATAAGVGLGIVGLAVLLLGLAGLVNRWTAMALLLVGPAVHVPHFFRWAATKPEVPVGAWLAERVLPSRWLLLAAAPLLGVMVTGASILPGILWRPEDPHPYDALEYHLQAPREWYEAGRIVELPHNVYTYFPFGVEMHYLAAMHVMGGPWAAMYACQFFSVAFVLLAGTAVYGAIASMPRARPLAAAAGALLTVSVPWMVMLGAVAYQEAGLALYSALALGWLLRAVSASPADRTRLLLVAGACAGFACGIKYTAFPMVLGAGAVGVAVLAGVTRDLRGWLAPLAGFVLTALLVPSPWLVRNALWTGNPVFPLAMGALGRGHLDAVQAERFHIAHAPPEALKPLGARAARLWSDVLADRGAGFQYGLVFWPAALAALGAALALRSRRAVVLAVFLVVVLVVWVGFTHLLARFLVLAVPAGALAVGLPRRRGFDVTSAALAVLLALISLVTVTEKLSRQWERTQAGLFDLDDPRWLLGPDLRDELEKPGTTVWIVGDAQGFLYRVPAARLKYRTVFNLPGEAPDMYRAWLGAPLEDVHGLVIINPLEVERLSKTYYKVPGLPPDYPLPRDQTRWVRR